MEHLIYSRRKLSFWDLKGSHVMLNHDYMKAPFLEEAYRGLVRYEDSAAAYFL